MLAAEIRKKLGRALACSSCRESSNTESYFGFEDVLTSNVFGALRYLEPCYGLEPALTDLGLGALPGATIELWPAEDGCEPDVVIDAGHVLIVVEAKLHASFGDDQLPREVLFAHRRAAGRPWRLLCVTDHLREPLHSAYGPNRARVPGSERPLGEAVATYFENESELGLGVAEIARRIAWTSWSRIAHLLKEARTALAPPASARALLDDLLESLGMRGLARPPFGGFRSLPSADLAWTPGVWMGAYAPAPIAVLTWAPPPLREAWAATGWMTRASTFRGFSSAARTAIGEYVGWTSCGRDRHD